MTKTKDRKARKSATNKSSAGKRTATPKAGRTGAKPSPEAERSPASTPQRSQRSGSKNVANKSGETAARNIGAKVQSQRAGQPKTVKPPKRKNVSQTIPNGRTLQTRDEYIGEENKKYRKPGYGKKGNYRKVVVVDSNRNDEIAVVKLTTSDRAIPIKGYKNGKSKFKPFVETKDSDGQPIKIGRKFKENSQSADVPNEEITKIKKRCFKESKNSEQNREIVHKMKGRKKSTEN